MTDSPRLGQSARRFLIDAEKGNILIYVPSIVLAELFFVNVKLGLPMAFSHKFARIASAGQFEFIEFRAEDTLQFEELSAIPEMHDRIIVGVARKLQCPRLTHDGTVTNSGIVTVIW